MSMNGAVWRLGACVCCVLLGLARPARTRAQDIPTVTRAQDIPTVTLAEVLKRARVAAPDVLRARAALERARAERRAAGGAWLPSLSADGTVGYGYNNQLILPGLPRIDSLSIDRRANLALEWAAVDLARSAAIGARSDMVQSQRAATEAEAQAAVAFAAEAYVRAGAASELIVDARLSVERRTQQYQAISDLVRSGTRSPVEAERAKVEMLSASYALAMRQSEELAAFAVLAAALGRPATKPVRPASQNSELPNVAAASSAPHAAKLALEHRPELRAAAWAVAALRQDYKAALLERLPTLGVAASALAFHSEVKSGEGIDGSQYGGTAGVYLRWRGLDPAVLYKAGVAEASVVEAQRERDASAHQIGAEAVAAYHELTRATLDHDRAVEVLRIANVTREAQNDRYRVGVASLLELLDAEDLEQTARQRRIEASRDEAIATARLLASCGLLR
jgi:outer membrane protein